MAHGDDSSAREIAVGKIGVVPREMAEPMRHWIALPGWVGASLILMAYGLPSAGSIDLGPGSISL